MARIEVSTRIKGPAERVYHTVKDMEDFPNFIRDIKSLKVIERLPDKIITAWDIEIKGRPLSWKEEDVFDDGKLELSFSAFEGEYKQYQGRWKVRPQRNYAELSIELDFDWGAPMLEKYIGKTLKKRARLALLGMLLAIKKKVEA